MSEGVTEEMMLIYRLRKCETFRTALSRRWTPCYNHLYLKCSTTISWTDVYMRHI